MITRLARFYVGPTHPWPAWHGDVVVATRNGIDEPSTDCDGETLLPEWEWLHQLMLAIEAPCPFHKHIYVKGSWSGVIPINGLEPLDDDARSILLRLCIAT